MVYFGFSLNGHGFDFQRSEDHDNLGNRAFIILQNIGSGNNFIPREIVTSVQLDSCDDRLNFITDANLAL